MWIDDFGCDVECMYQVFCIDWEVWVEKQCCQDCVFVFVQCYLFVVWIDQCVVVVIQGLGFCIVCGWCMEDVQVLQEGVDGCQQQVLLDWFVQDVIGIVVQGFFLCIFVELFVDDDDVEYWKFLLQIGYQWK